MSEQIGVGDKVMLVWGCCAIRRQQIGRVDIVKGFLQASGFCKSCGQEINRVTFARFSDQRPYDGFPLAWLKKIPPEGEQVDEHESYFLGADDYMRG